MKLQKTAIRKALKLKRDEFIKSHEHNKEKIYHQVSKNLLEIIKQNFLLKREFNNNILHLNIAGFSPIRSEIDCFTIFDYLDSHINDHNDINDENKINQQQFQQIQKQIKLEYSLPCHEPKRSPLIFRKFKTKEDLDQGHFGVYIPKTEQEIVIPDLILVPFLGFDQNLIRIGYGGGYYDTTFNTICDNQYQNHIENKYQVQVSQKNQNLIQNKQLDFQQKQQEQNIISNQNETKKYNENQLQNRPLFVGVGFEIQNFQDFLPTDEFDRALDYILTEQKIHK
ncbi:hypothetical protein PPERSA_07966 [Pseudocohnilembus persalinus]|uniref:5-formyltetrahydrofolate cyclo-ligase n=1 Tax=Pseudocohnilembus persalinus TaxID=266149 RepID=A0A0V0QB79_PSEPJ|nr:hypothetical protein PPERSA_07966 [Pseudocohnilembus persalinus]|eukprot:KRW99481.1 hypothetical protein PPERSA_07966 [Pseudocohnilembus persalinus]